MFSRLFRVLHGQQDASMQAVAQGCSLKAICGMDEPLIFRPFAGSKQQASRSGLLTLRSSIVGSLEAVLYA